MATATPTEILEAVWTTLKERYPMLEYMGARGDEWLEEFRPRVAAAPTPDAAFDLIDELVCRLNDYHTWFARPGRRWRFEGLAGPLARAEAVLEGRRRVTAIVDAGDEPAVQPGDEILAVDGEPVTVARGRQMKHAVGSTPGARWRAACRQMLLGPPEQPVRLTVRSAAGPAPREAVLPRHLDPPPLPVVSCREVEAIPVIRITRWADPAEYDIAGEFDRLLEQFRARPYLVIDVRGNGGGSDSVADQITGRFLRRPVISSIFFLRQAPGLTYERHVWQAEPRGPWRYEGRYAVLIDEGCMSACEHFTSGMLEGGAYLAGMTTNGACGGTQVVSLPGDARLCCARVFDLHGRDPSARHGIQPHARAPRKLEELRAGRDAALEAALAWLRSGKRLPQHPQRLATGP